jgi:hypothetical protein
MKLGPLLRYWKDPAFWRGFQQGFRSSLNSPANRARTRTSFRIALYSSAIGASGLLAWAKHARAVTARGPLNTSQELAVSLVGAFALIAVVHFARWVWRRWVAFRAVT